MIPFLLGGGAVVTDLTIAADTHNYNVFSAAGSPTGVVHVTVTIAAGVIVSDSTRTGYALRIGTGWAVGSTVTIVNNGYIEGYGGNGAAGSGGDALRVEGVDVSIDNTNGYVRGGGGGGGTGPDTVDCGGGGGGGGQGNPGGSGAAGGSGPFYTGSAGASGSRTGPGGGGAAGVFGAEHGGNGGSGGSWGQSGDTSGASSDGARTGGGIAGKAVAKNGRAVTWLGGNNTTQVKGAVA